MRLKGLHWALSTANFGPEAENINCAIQGYKSGKISYFKHFTIIWAGLIVDTAPDYAEFVHTRQERLDRYFRDHGPGWMWYEAPLDIPPDSRVVMAPSVSLTRSSVWSNMEPYFVKQAFWKRFGMVARLPQGLRRPEPNPSEPSVNAGTVDCQANGPMLAFRTLLDSGATYPSLPLADFASLGIDITNYGAQTITQVQHAVGVTPMRIFELGCQILDNKNKSLVYPNDAVYPSAFKYLGGLTPVTAHPQTAIQDPHGRETQLRVSGLIPFLACYISSTPTIDQVHLGEDRNDVLGLHKMPGQRKWAIDVGNQLPNFHINPEKFGNPKIVFNHRNGMIVDTDELSRKHCSQIHYNMPGVSWIERTNAREWIEDHYNLAGWPVPLNSADANQGVLPSSLPDLPDDRYTPNPTPMIVPGYENGGRGETGRLEIDVTSRDAAGRMERYVVPSVAAAATSAPTPTPTPAPTTPGATPAKTPRTTP